MFDAIMDWLQAHPKVTGLIGLYVAERLQAWMGERWKLILALMGAVDNPMNGKGDMRESKFGQTVLLNTGLDKVSPSHKGPGGFIGDIVPRVSKGRKVLNGLLKVIPLLSRFWLPGVK